MDGNDLEGQQVSRHARLLGRLLSFTSAHQGQAQPVGVGRLGKSDLREVLGLFAWFGLLGHHRPRTPVLDADGRVQQHNQQRTRQLTFGAASTAA